MGAEAPRRGASWGLKRNVVGGGGQGGVEGASRAGSPGFALSPGQPFAVQVHQLEWIGRGQDIILCCPWAQPEPEVPMGSERWESFREVQALLLAQTQAGDLGTGFLVEGVGWRRAREKQDLIEIVRNKGLFPTAENRRENTLDLMNFLQYGCCHGSPSCLGLTPSSERWGLWWPKDKHSQIVRAAPSFTGHTLVRSPTNVD